MVERFSMNPVSCKLLNEAWKKEFPDEVAIAERMLALLDEPEHYKSREERVTKLVLDNSTSWDALYKKLEAAERRVAELESNEVREVGNQFLVVRHPGKTPVIKHCTGDLEEFLRKLIEQDPLVTIDIITHRYYGIGGQWVQDAVEYLHMMSDAGIRIKGE
ncbi:ead/Ea22-like family protein [Salmonella enterica]|uniref:ead/Ea22-like family protein n=1 Tax=Salmonella enterica TaxID=28901 RepID=UPI000E761915|nr:ead/Ea22-like family protein [Salmonella enterica]EAA3601719.1 ead/Ea22-like family protein [Salmonella enterica subsp. enterica serovar Schwarzengrund]EAS8764697.1 ead/Ea22-like family protein [Salmonella enterica]ECU9356228.1 ead/Ea22-like family protein [Salmonella enterica subsp. enterica serovar Schwarzengrund]ECW2921926.1 ead/Ea22-like family protein [Salmonella enterica subsp. enterica serovar Schwarzengrund]EDA0498523.1 ead/Ea22-like family protein [Salmonella enterica subsp. enteri